MAERSSSDEMFARKVPQSAPAPGPRALPPWPAPAPAAAHPSSLPRPDTAAASESPALA